MAVRMRIVSLESMPLPDAEPAVSHARMIVQTGNGAPVIPVARLTQTTRYLSPIATPAFVRKLETGKFGRIAPITDTEDALPRRVTTEYELADAPQQDPGTGGMVTRRIVFSLHRADQGTDPVKGHEQTELALTIEDFEPALVASSSTDADQHSQVAQSKAQFQKETILLEPLTAAGPTEFALLVPFRFSGHGGWGVAAIVDLAPGSDDPRHRDLLDRTYAELGRSIPTVATPTTLPTAEEPTLRTALANLSVLSEQRQTLVFLSDQTAAALCLESAMASDAPLLSRLCGRISRQSASTPMDRASVGWMLDHEALSFLAELSTSQKLPPELATVLTLYAGEAGRHDASMEEVLRGLTSRADLEARLIGENLIFLEDGSPASRVRAFDWLAARGRAPAGYDPLGSPRQRRAAMDKAIASGTAGGAP
jgi:hypothetical protein